MHAPQKYERCRMESKCLPNGDLFLFFYFFIWIIIIASCICILCVRRKKNIRHRLHHTEKPESFPDVTESPKLTIKDIENFVFEDEQVSADAEGKDTHPIPLTAHMLHLSPSLSSLQIPYPTWNNPRVTEYPKVSPPEFRVIHQISLRKPYHKITIFLFFRILRFSSNFRR